MSKQSEQSQQSLPAYAQLIQTGTAYWASQLVLVAAKLDLADRLAGGAKSASELAEELGLHALSLYRYMRTLAGMGILTEVDKQTFALTPLGEALKKDAPGSARASILTLTGHIARQSWDRLLYSLETGKTGFERACGQPLFDYLAEHPDEASLFSETMVGFHGAEPPAVAAAYDFDALGSIVDVGGATGNMLVNILQRHKRPRGVLFDLPHVVSDAHSFIEAHGLKDRISIESGSFFEAVPSGHDAYIMSHVIHDWDEDQCQTILQNCRRAVGRGGRLLIVEMVLPEGDAPHVGKMLDMMMLVGPGGRERTTDEYATLLRRADFRLTRVVPTKSDVSIVEAVPA
jgi:hypothetical protein